MSQELLQGKFLCWNDVKTAHGEAHEAFYLWKSSSKPKSGPIFNLMQTASARFMLCEIVDLWKVVLKLML